jgi:hypothetical protein
MIAMPMALAGSRSPLRAALTDADIAKAHEMRR